MVFFFYLRDEEYEYRSFNRVVLTPIQPIIQWPPYMIFWWTVQSAVLHGLLVHLIKCYVTVICEDIQGDTKERELLKNATKIEEMLEKKFIDRN